MSNTTNDLSGKIIAGCELIRQLGCGNNGVVYLARQKKLNRPVACQILSPDLQNDPDFLDNLHHEASNAAKLMHPNIIQALDAGNDNGLKYFLMEYVDGDSLEYIRSKTPEIISTQFLLKIALQLVDAMDCVWKEHQIIHGDIKPGNLMVTRNNHKLKIGDLGLAHSANGSSGSPEDVMITPLYAAPEIISTQKPSTDPRSDIYSFGVMLYELFCGTAPFTGSIENILQSHIYVEPVPLFEQNPDMDKELSLLIDSMLAKNPENRPKNWQSLRVSLSEIYRRLFPESHLPELAPPSKTAPAAMNAADAMRMTSWSAEKKKKLHVLAEKHPFLLPALLVIAIVTALLSIANNLGLFE